MNILAGLVMWMLTVKDSDLSLWGRTFRWVLLVFLVAVSANLLATAFTALWG